MQFANHQARRYERLLFAVILAVRPDRRIHLNFRPEILAQVVLCGGIQQHGRSEHVSIAGGHSDPNSISSDTSLDKFNVDCRQISPHGENVRGWLRDGCWHVLTYHGIGSDQDGWEPIPLEQFSAQITELATHRDSGNVEIVTFKEGVSRVCRQKTL